MDFPERHPLFALLGRTGDIDQIKYMLTRSNAVRDAWATIPPADYPTLVTFTDVADPMTVVAVDPAAPAGSLGPGYRIARIAVRLTDDPVSHGIVQRLPWLATA